MIPIGILNPNLPQDAAQIPASSNPDSRVRKVILVVALIYYALSVVMFRGVIASIPSVLSGDVVINADELVPFFNPYSQFLDQAAGKFNDLTNGYEFRVRYSFHTTWMRYYKVLPFAIPIAIPTITFTGYLATAWFVKKIMPGYRVESIYTISAAPVLVIFLIMDYAKITHFYTLILGFAMFLAAIAFMTYGLVIPQKRPYTPMAGACLITLLNPAVHYLVLFGLYMALAVATLVVRDAWRVLRSGEWKWAWKFNNWLAGLKIFRNQWRRLFVEVRFWRCVGAFFILIVATLIPYYLFVKFYALNGVANLSETVPADYFFIVDASISPGHLLAFDMAGIMDKFTTGDYLSKSPRWANLVYTALMFFPLIFSRMRRRLFADEPRRALLLIIYVSTFFSMWATLGYTQPDWLPTFHRTIAFISNFANGMRSFIGDLVVSLLATVVQVLRFPHRFEFIMFVFGCLVIPISLIWIEDELRLWAASAAPSLGKLSRAARQFVRRLAQKNVLSLCIAVLALVPMLSNTAYTMVFLSGNFSNFLAPYPVGSLKEIKAALLKLPPGKVVVLPPTETAKEQVDINGIGHKFIDKFHIYYLDLPSYYYGLTGDSDNKHEFFLLLRAMYYGQSWWVNIARDLDLRYIIVNKELKASSVGGQEYLRSFEKYLIPELDKESKYVTKIIENESYALYEFTDLPEADRIPLFLDTDWNTFVQILSRNLDLTRYYDLRHTNVVGDLEGYERLTLVTTDMQTSVLNLFEKLHKQLFFRPSSTILAFNPNLISSSYYLSPMFRLFQFFSDSKYNRLKMITPGLWGTIEGGFIGVPAPTQFRIDVTFPESGLYRLLLRGAAAKTEVILQSKLLDTPQYYLLQSDPANLAFYASKTVFTSARQPFDVSNYSAQEMGKLIPTDVVAINNKYQYFDLGTVQTEKGKFPLYFEKKDASPLLVEGILVIPEDEYVSLTLPDNVIVITPNNLCCGTVGP